MDIVLINGVNFSEDNTEPQLGLIGNRQIMMRPDIKLPQPFASWSNSL